MRIPTNASAPPTKLEFVILETTRRCNLRCIQCDVSEENNEGHYPYEDLPIEAFRKLLPSLSAHKPEIQLSGNGETLLHPAFSEMLAATLEAGCRVCLQTNGTLITPGIAEKIVRGGVAFVVISLDAATPHLYETIRRRARFKRVVANIELLHRMKQELQSGLPTLGVEFVAMKQNIHELPAVIALAGRLGVRAVTVSNLVEFRLTIGQSVRNDPATLEWYAKAEGTARDCGIELDLRPLPGREVVGSTTRIDAEAPQSYKGLRKACPWPFERMFVRFNGDVQPCCVNPESYGNLLVQSFDEIWNGPKYRTLREAIMTDEPVDLCVRCPLYGWEPLPELCDASSAVGPPSAPLSCPDPGRAPSVP